MISAPVQTSGREAGEVKRAVMAVANSMLMIGYHMLKTGQGYLDLLRIIWSRSISIGFSSASSNECNGSDSG